MEENGSENELKNLNSCNPLRFPPSAFPSISSLLGSSREDHAMLPSTPLPVPCRSARSSTLPKKTSVAEDTQAPPRPGPRGRSAQNQSGLGHRHLPSPLHH